MILTADGFQFDFQDALDGFIFDEADKSKPRYHGLSHGMKAVDLIVEFASAFVFIKMKHFDDAERYGEDDAFHWLRRSLKHKYRDSFVYRWAEKPRTKDLHYLCLLNLDTPLLDRLARSLRREIPCGADTPLWHRAILNSCFVLNQKLWEKQFPKWPVKRV